MGLTICTEAWRALTKKVWRAEEIKASQGEGIKMTYLSPDGEENYPGNLKVTLLYLLNENNELFIQYLATADKKTVVSLTNHNYYNLTGCKENVLNHVLQIEADHITELGEHQIPTGKYISVAGTPFDFNRPRLIGENIKEVEGGYDHNFVLKNHNKQVRQAAVLSDAACGRKIEFMTDSPGIQLYTSNGMQGVAGRNGITYNQYWGVCLETQMFPDTPNKPSFPSCVLNPGEEFVNRTVLKLGLI
ncbi:MAG: galactose mutarotase [Bacteroidales bacterium]|nr:galactose mutarotase [Bacteroidales bacterium]